MGTVPTGKLERELRKLYVSWVSGLSAHEDDMDAYIESFRIRSTALITQLGGDIARLGSYFADFPAPKELELSPYAGKIYDEMQLAAVRAGVASGLQATDMARAMLRAGLERSFHKLNRLARTETVSAYWKNQWDSTRGLDLVLLWSVEMGPRTCEWCKERDGLVVEYQTIRDHPNGRCTLLPTLPQNVKYKGSLDSEGNIFWDPGFERRMKRMQEGTQRVSQPSQGSPAGRRATAPLPVDAAATQAAAAALSVGDLVSVGKTGIGYWKVLWVFPNGKVKLQDTVRAGLTRTYDASRLTRKAT